MNHARGFTLIEMAIVLVIMTILIGGLAMPLSAQIQARRIAETKKTLEDAREAIIGFALSSATSPCTCVYTSDTLDPATTTCPNSLCSARFESMTGDATFNVSPRHYLPCPDKLDDGDPTTTNDGDGVSEDRVSGACPVDDGYLPWVTLAVANQDAWGNRLRYAVTSAFSNGGGFSNADNGDLQICNTSANAGSSDCASGNIASNVAAVVMSHGPNGWGARSVNDTTLADPTSDDERENAGTDHADKEFVSRTPSDDFDDLIRWISADQLRGRICPAGGCP